MTVEGNLIVRFEDQQIFVSSIQHDLLKVLDKSDKLTRGQIIEKIEKITYPWTTTYNNLDSLIKRGFARKLDVSTSGKRGRPRTYFYLTERGKSLIEKIEEDLNEF